MKTVRTSSRKQQHVEITVTKDVSHKNKTAGFERWDFVHNALPEINYSEINTTTQFLGKHLSFPLIVASMTGGYAEAVSINKQLAELCATAGLALGVGSQRQALENSRHHRSFSIVREVSKDIPVFGNIGATELVHPNAVDSVRRLAELIEADGFAIHLNPLQEMLQPEGNTKFSGVLNSIERLVKTLEIPVIVKEIGAGISPSVGLKLLNVGVRYIDVAGAGGTSWAGVEILRTAFKSKSQQQSVAKAFWDWGIPTVDALRGICALKQQYVFQVIASGGISNGIDMAKAFAFGADFVSVARPILKTLKQKKLSGTLSLIEQWKMEFRGAMFLTGSQTLQQLQQQQLIQLQ